MNRREMLSALAALPGVASIERLEMTPDQMLVLQCDEYVTVDAQRRIHAEVTKILPGVKVMVLDKGWTLKVAEAAK